MVKVLATVGLVLSIASSISANPVLVQKPKVAHKSQHVVHHTKVETKAAHIQPATHAPNPPAATLSPGHGSTGGGAATPACTFTTAAAAMAGKLKCSTIVLDNLTVPAGVTLNLTGLNTGTTVIFQGTTTWLYEQWSGPLVSVSGQSIKVVGNPGHCLNGNGAKWWDGLGGNGGLTKPKFFFAHGLTGTSSITNLNLVSCPVQAFSIDNSVGLTITNVTIDNSAGSALGHNTDAFDIGSSSNILITGANVRNQDDCLAINSGTGITFTQGTCVGGHGLSIGSVGNRSDNVVSDVTISETTVRDSANGVRIKTIAGATGTVKGITFKDIKLSGITGKGIVIEQDYQNGKPNGIPTDGVPITDLTLSNVSGTVQANATDIYILCAACSNWKWTGVSVTGSKKPNVCKGVPTGVPC